MRRRCGRGTGWLPRPGQLPSAVPRLAASPQAGAAAGETDLGATTSGNGLDKRVRVRSLSPEKTTFSSFFLPSLVNGKYSSRTHMLK